MNCEKIVGWHGTTFESFKIISKSGFCFEDYQFNKRNQRLPNDLGSGVYFFVEDPSLESPSALAYKYVLKYKDQMLKKGNFKPKIIKADISFNKEFVLDLDEWDNVEAILNIQKVLKRELNEAVQNIEQSGTVNRGNFDGLLVELLVALFKKNKEIDIEIVMKRTFTNVENKLGEYSIRKSNFPNGKEISVRDIGLISNFT